MKNSILLIVIFFTIISCKKQKEIPVLNSIFFNSELQNGYKSVLNNSSLNFKELKYTNVPKEFEPFTAYESSGEKNPYFKSEIKKLYVSLVPNDKTFSITLLIEFNNTQDKYKEFDSLQKLLIPFAKDSSLFDKSPYKNIPKVEKHFQMKLKDEYGGGFIEIVCSLPYNTFVVRYDTKTTLPLEK